MSQSHPKTPPKTHSSRLPSYSNTSGTRGRSCRDNVPSQQCACQMSFHQPTVSLHSVTREHPGRARSAQRGGILLRACPANSITWILQKQLLCQHQEVHSRGRGLAGCCSYELSPGHVRCRHSSCLESAMTLLHANSINPQTEPLPFGVLFMAPELFKKKPQQLV